MFEVKDNYGEIFDIEVEGLCYALSNYPGEIFGELIESIIYELGPSIRMAVACNVAFDVMDVSARISKASKYLVDEREIAFWILNCLPHPKALDEDAQCVMGQIVDQVEQAYGEALTVCEEKWKAESKEKIAPIKSGKVEGPVFLETVARREVTQNQNEYNKLNDHMDDQLDRSDVQEKMLENII